MIKRSQGDPNLNYLEQGESDRVAIGFIVGFIGFIGFMWLVVERIAINHRSVLNRASRAECRR